MLENNEIKMTLGEFLELRDECSEYNVIIKEIVRICKESGKAVWREDILNVIYDRVSDSSIIEEIEAIQDDGEE